MTTPATCTFDIVPPRRPGIDDVGGAQKQDDILFPPDPVEMPTAADDNQHQRLLVAMGEMVAVAMITVRYAAGVPSINKVASPIAAVIAGTFTVVDNGVGDCSLTWAANTFPAAVADPFVNATGATIGKGSAEIIANGVRVRMANAAGAAADINFVVQVF